MSENKNALVSGSILDFLNISGRARLLKDCSGVASWLSEAHIGEVLGAQEPWIRTADGKFHGTKALADSATYPTRFATALYFAWAQAGAVLLQFSHASHSCAIMCLDAPRRFKMFDVSRRDKQH